VKKHDLGKHYSTARVQFAVAGGEEWPQSTRPPPWPARDTATPILMTMQNVTDGKQRNGPTSSGGSRMPDQSPASAASVSELSAGARVLVIEDEPGIVDFVRRGLQSEGFLVESAMDGIEGERLALSDSFDAIVLDLMLPGRSGLEVLARVRHAKPSVPVIVLTARGEIEDRVAGLDAGAVDYLVKPFSIAELVARVRAQLRVFAQASTTTLSGEGIEANLLTRKVSRGGRAVTLSSTEFELLVYLLRHQGRVLSREQILSSVWGYQHDPQTNVVDVYIGYLRRKLGRTDDPAPICTVRGVGYRMGSAN
jgi:DNA-binding response OmpR family regulator